MLTILCAVFDLAARANELRSRTASLIAFLRCYDKRDGFQSLTAARKKDLSIRDQKVSGRKKKAASLSGIKLDLCPKARRFV